MPRPGSHQYDTKRARTRKRLEDEGVAPDKAADERAERELREQGMRPRKASERAAGPKGER
ncbi:hypothetical protein SAMN04489712_10730 [Thermomonospora echinospora]|uniref:Uncharacterized protein n=1 Tax=Thermomonospora echinospora TaxID=1992 RepID=A0A1H6BDG7_9ACTN|nr:hypothetical protein [Thermomonospora echinospora]SEG58891.1 hypothetical protein SAMN04489712_10730 [Thermomonospora echinospora]